MTIGPPARSCERLRDAEVFAEALRLPSLVRTSHFALHHVPNPAPAHLSTNLGTERPRAVDKSLGVALPKRLAKRAVTRNLLRRQIYAVAQQRVQVLATGSWVVRLRAPFPEVEFPSAASAALKDAARRELVELIERAVVGA